MQVAAEFQADLVIETGEQDRMSKPVISPYRSSFVATRYVVAIWNGNMEELRFRISGGSEKWPETVLPHPS